MQPYAQQNPDQNGEMMDIEDLNRLGRVRGPCPFYLSREMAATANIIFMPYNYLVDAKIRGGLQTRWENSVLIFDEAHNIEVSFQRALLDHGFVCTAISSKTGSAVIIYIISSLDRLCLMI